MDSCSVFIPEVYFFWVQTLIAAATIIFGGILAFYPGKVIDLQIKAYSAFNWKIEPISMEKERRNMRICGVVLIVLGIATYIMTRRTGSGLTILFRF